jgi:WD40 repeat protein
MAHPEVAKAAFSPDGKTLLTKTQGNKLRLWDLDTGWLLSSPQEKPDWARTITFSLSEAWSPDGKILLHADENNVARLREIATGRALGPGLPARGRIAVVAFHPNGHIVLTATEDGMGQLWDARTCKPLGPAWRQNRWIGSAAFSPDGQLVAVGDSGSLRLANVPAPIAGSLEGIALWAQVLTGLELDEYHVVRPLHAATWQERRHQLQELGGTPE